MIPPASALRLCGALNCERPIQTAGLCNAHYKRSRAGKPLDTPIRRRPTGTAVERFLACVEKTAECWLWTHGTTAAGYGHIQIEGVEHLAHRLSYALFVGPIPDGLCVCHKCDVRACVRPDHFFLGTVGDNNRDMFAKGRDNNQPPRGEAHPGAKLTAEYVRAIRTGGERTSMLAERYGVGRDVISRVRSGKTWKCVTDPPNGTAPARQYATGADYWRERGAK